MRLLQTILHAHRAQPEGTALHMIDFTRGLGSKAKPQKGIKVKPGTQWLKPGLVARVRHVKGEQQLRHATLREIRED